MPRHGGREKGTPNHNGLREAALKRMAEKYPDWNPLMAAIDLANQTDDSKLELDAITLVLKHTMPTLKAIEVSGPDGGAIPVHFDRKDSAA